MRVIESGVGLASLTQTINPNIDKSHETSGHISIPSISIGNQGADNSTGSTNIGYQGNQARIPIARGPRPISTIGTKENAIQVMTAEMREYQRTGVNQMPQSFNDETFFPEPENFDYGYEPTQESQWNNENPSWVPSGVKELTPGPNLIPAQHPSHGPHGIPPPQLAPPQLSGLGQIPQMNGPPPQLSGNLSQIVGPPPNQMIGPPPNHMPNRPPGHMHGNPPPLLGMRIPPNMGNLKHIQ